MILLTIESGTKSATYRSLHAVRGLNVFTCKLAALDPTKYREVSARDVGARRIYVPTEKTRRALFQINVQSCIAEIPKLRCSHYVTCGL